MGERKTVVNVAGSADSQRPQKRVGRRGKKVGSFPEERNHVQKAMEPLTQLSREMEMVLSVFKTLTAGP